MTRGYGFMAVACWCALATGASAQYPQQGGQPLPSAEYFTALNGGLPSAPQIAPNLAPASQWAVPVAASSGFEQQPRLATSIRQAPPTPPQPMPGSPDNNNYSAVPAQGGPMPMAGGYSDNGAMIPDPVPSGLFGTGTCGPFGSLCNRFNGYGVPVYGAFNQFNRCCPCQSACGSCGTGGGSWGSGIGGAAPAGSPFAGAVSGCGDAGACATGPWYGSAAALFLWRAGGNRTWLTYNENNNADQLLNTQMANGNFYGGQITIGRYLCCNHAVEATYWGVATSSATVGLTDPNNKLGTPLDEQNVTMGGAPFGPPSPPNFAPFDGSHQQEIIRQDNIQNGEINFLTFPVAYNPMSRFRVALLSGVRYFRFQDSLIYGGAAYGTNFGDNGGTTDAFLNVRTTNNLLGSQIGARMTYFVTPRLSFFATPKMGLYSNMMGVRASLYSGAGSEAFNVSNTSTGFAAMGEIDLGGQFYITPRCAVFAAYRLIGVTGVATADTQIPPYLADTAGFTQLNHNDALLLQGVLTGLSWNF
ncbi:MAG TPA: BBP7 family outer membrane beta-barrel protein [Pirellulales bacterium]|nr:BBP7 family outer membrane beta-barrel protein [Pirellulales bacterium]